MIASLFINLIYIFVKAILVLLSSLGPVSEQSAISASLAVVGQYLAPLNTVLPIDTVLLIFAFDLFFEGLFFTYKMIRWAYRKVPTIS